MALSRSPQSLFGSLHSRSPSIINPENKPPVALSTEVKADASQFSLFQPEVDLHFETLSMLKQNPIYQSIISKYEMTSNYMHGACYWNEFQQWVSNNTPEGIIEDPATCPAALIYLAFHLPDQYGGENPTAPYFELMKPDVIKDEWKQISPPTSISQSSEPPLQKVGRPSGGLLIMAAEMLIELKYQQKTSAHDSIIKTLLLIAAGFEHTPGALRPKAYFLLGEIELSICYEKNIQSLMFAFDFFISYLKFLPYKTKLALRDDTIAQDIASWHKRHPNGHPLMFWLGNFNLEIYNYRLYRQNEYNPDASEESKIDTSVVIRSELKKIKHLKELYPVLYSCILPKYLPTAILAYQARPVEDEQPLIPEKILRDAATQLMLPKFNDEMSRKHTTYPAYLEITTECLFLFRKLTRLTNGDLINATVDDEGTLTFYPTDERKWEISQVATIAPRLSAVNTLIQILNLSKSNSSKDAIIALMEVRNSLNVISEILGSSARRKKEMNALKEKYERDLRAVAEHFKKSADELRRLAVRTGNDNAAEYLSAAESYRLGTKSLSEVCGEQTTVSPPHQLPPSSSEEYKATASRIRRGSLTLDKTVQDFLEHYQIKHDGSKYDRFYAQIFNAKNLNPTPEDIIRDALKPSKSNFLFANGKHKNKRALLLLDEYGIDISEPPNKPDKFKSFHAEVLFNAYTKVYEENQLVTVHAAQISPQKASIFGT